MRVARIEQDSSLILADLSATYVVSAFLCSCFQGQVMSNHTAIKKKFQWTQFPKGSSSNEPGPAGFPYFKLFKYFCSSLGSGVREPDRLDWAPEPCTEA